MNKLLMVLMLCVSVFSISACSWFKFDNGNVVVPYNLTTADQSHYNTIGLDFKDYYASDENLDPHFREIYDQLLLKWELEGSDWEVFTTIAGQEFDGIYFVYLKADESLTEADLNSRYLNVKSWELNVESRKGPLYQLNEVKE